MVSTLRDVAKHAGVSVATVSRYVNRSGNVRAQTAGRIRQAIAELGFRPNVVGRSLKTATTRSLGVVIPSLSNPVFADAVSGIGQTARAEGYNLMFMATDYDRDAETQTVGALLDYRIDGLILTVSDPGESPVLDLLERTGTPYILIYNQFSLAARPSVTVDNVAAGHDAAEALIGLGHRRLGMISGSFGASDRARARRDGFVRAARDAALAEPVVREVDFLTMNVDAILDDVFKDRSRAPSALFCSNDLLAISLIGALRRRGVRVPDDVSVIGFDGIAVGSHQHPTLTTVVQPSREMGQTAARQLLDCLNGGNAPTGAVLPHILRLGESAGPAGKPDPAALQEPDQTVQRRTAQ
ncbi:LacI family DNA-binding transcriptional regulator [Varunaivibrio sulfuroxidans]|uniref:LacI family transcriptional regulator n=1 Tax=Varunaivibrio sulfuroxidans TaxID=1773489 RepID=A0A4R3J4Y7_9PROT|nr:LacI family DNA-binding transcriptional regulator [Varunaivibrio sulfuroxidans]TCS60939.1 LacI family transcriptional regulator [Varunaivibrio sulfuroxidans]WES31653.1 LacI family DNA-binding transcriptional regulator [Varunaivibrio sulfuroxidans]